MTEIVRIWFLALCGLGIGGFVTTAIRFRPHRDTVERKIGPVPIPAPLVAFLIAGTLIATGIGEVAAGWWGVRFLGVLLSLAWVVLVPWTAWTLGRFFIPGAAVLRDHVLVASGPFALMRHPLLAGMLAFWLGAAMGTLNWLLLILWIPLLGATRASSRQEDELLRETFGPAFELYESRTGRFLPKPRARRAAGG